MRLRKKRSSRKRWAHGRDGARERMWAGEDVPRKKNWAKKGNGVREKKYPRGYWVGPPYPPKDHQMGES